MSDETKRQRPEDEQPPVQPSRTSSHPIGTPRGISSNSGLLASAAWLVARGLFVQPDKPWHVQLLITSERMDVRLTISIRQDEWAFEFVHGSRASHIRVRDVAEVVGRDDHGLLALAPALKDFGNVIREIERRFQLWFRRAESTITSSIPGSEPIIRAWIVSL